MALETSTTSVPTSPHISWSDSFSQGQSSMESLSSILPSFPSSLFSTENPSHSLLHDPTISAQVSAALRHPNSGAGDNHLCRWLYDTFQFAKPDLQLVVLKFLPIIAGLYLSRAAMRKSLAGFEAVLLALYAHETTFRNGQAITVNIPDLTHCSIYHETKLSNKNTSTELHLAVISPSLEPYGAVRSTRRARIVGVALELYYSKINEMPVDSKLAFCEFCAKWAGQDEEAYKENGATQKHEAIDQTETKSMETTSNNATANETNEKNDKENESHQVDQKDHVHHNAEKSHRPPKINRQSHESGQEDKGDKESRRIPLPWELLQPTLRILGHCLMGPNKNEELYEAACVACRSLYARCLHDINSEGILATGSLLRLVKMNADVVAEEIDHTDIPNTDVINI